MDPWVFEFRFPRPLLKDFFSGVLATSWARWCNFVGCILGGGWKGEESYLSVSIEIYKNGKKYTQAYVR